MTEEATQVKPDGITKIVIGIISAVITSSILAMAAALWTSNARLATIGDSMERMEVSVTRIDDRLKTLELKVAGLPKEVPPAWFLDQVKDHGDRIKELERLMLPTP